MLDLPQAAGTSSPDRRAFSDVPGVHGRGAARLGAGAGVGARVAPRPYYQQQCRGGGIPLRHLPEVRRQGCQARNERIGNELTRTVAPASESGSVRKCLVLSASVQQPACSLHARSGVSPPTP